MNKFGVQTIGLSIIAAATSCASALLAQPGERPSCRAFEHSSSSEQVQLHVACGDGGAVLGLVDAFELIPVPTLGGAIVLTLLDGSKRFWFVQSEGNRSLTVEEITGALARIENRKGDPRLADLEIEVVENAGRVKAKIRSYRSRGAAGPQTGIDLNELVARSRAVRVDAASRVGKR